MKIDVTRTEVVVGNGYIVNKGEYKINPCEFTFSEEYTAELVKKAVFDDGKTEKEMAIINNKCDIPYEVLDSDSFVLRVYAYQVVNEELELVYSPTPATVYLREGSYRGVTGLGEVITATQFEQYEQALNDGLNELEEGLNEVANVDIDVSKTGTTATVTITNRQGTEKSVEIQDGTDYVLTQEDKQEIIDIVEAEVSLDIPTKNSQLENDSGFITKEVNNLTNYYKKSETYTKQEIDGKISSVYKYKGTVASYNNLPSTDLTIGDVYNVEDTGDNYAWTGTAWDKLGGDIDLSGYYTKNETDTLLGAKQNTINSSHKLDADLVDDTNSTHKFTNSTEKNTWNAKYDKPNGGIPKTDLDSSVQTSLEKADSALQEHQDISGKEDSSNKTGVLNSSSTTTQYPHAKAVYDELVERDEEINQLYNDHPDITDTGTDLTLQGTGDLKMKVDVEGNSTQVQYEGYNLLPNTATSQTINGVTFTVNGDGTVLVNGTANNDITSFILTTFTPEINQPYFVNGCPSGGSTDSYYIRANVWGKNDVGNGFTNTSISGAATNISIDIKSGTVCNNLLFKPMIIEGSTSKPYEPFVGNQISPNPNYKQDINNVEGNVVVKGSSKNLFDKNDVTLGAYLKASGALEIDANSFYTDYIDVSKYIDITFSGVDDTEANRRIIFYDKNKTLLDYFATRNRTINVPSANALDNTKVPYYMRISANINYLNTLQVELGTQATSYVPFAENSVTFPLSQGQKLMLGDTLEDDGIHHKRGKVVFDGSNDEDWRLLDSTFTNTCKFVITGLTNALAVNRNKSICSHFITVYGDDNDYEHARNSSSSFLQDFLIYIDQSKASTVAELRTWLSQNPITVEYELAEDNIETYTSAQQTAYNKLKEMQSYYDLTYVVGSSNNAQPILTVQAKKSLKVINDEISNINSRLTLLEE